MIAERMGRTSDNVRDKYRGMGEEQHASVGDFWRFREIVGLVRALQGYCDRPLLRPGIERE